MKNLKMLASVILTVSLFGCGGSDSNGGDPGTGKVKTNIKNLSSGDLTSALSAGLPFALNDFGAASVGAGGLSSFKMYISSISLCEDMDIVGSGYNNPRGCTTVYDNSSSDNYSTFDVTAAASAGAGKYFDLLTSAGRSALAGTATLDPGTYKFGIINWFRPIKITAAVPLASGDTLYTKTCTGSPCDVTGMSTGPAQESIVDFNNGGTWMRFLKPLVVDGTEDFTIDLAFDLEKRIFAGNGVSNGQVREATGCTASTSGYCGIYMPILRLVPVAHKAAESTIVETYEMGGASAQWKVRVDVYYNSGDAAKTILAADIFPIPTASVDSSIAAGVYVYTVSDEGGLVTFKDVDGNAQLSDFTRGDTGTAKLKCPSGATLAGCTAGSTVDVNWTSRSVRTL